jgi:hypothetical protein
MDWYKTYILPLGTAKAWNTAVVCCDTFMFMFCAVMMFPDMLRDYEVYYSGVTRNMINQIYIESCMGGNGLRDNGVRASVQVR